jgi:hypothetical protein
MKSMTDTLNTLLTQEQLAEFLQVPVRTIEGWRSRSYGPRFLRVGRHVRYRPGSIAAWLDEMGTR